MLAATLGGILTTWDTFLPCFLWIFVGAPFVEKLRGNKALAAALSAITAAIVGVVLNLAIWFALHVLFRETRRATWGAWGLDLPVPGSVAIPSVVLTLAALVAIFRFRIGAMWVLAGCAAAGIVYWSVATWMGRSL
jgi:chromate transporter